MSLSEPNQPLTELCERAWKILIRHGTKSKANPRAGGSDDLMSYKFEKWHIYSRNRFLNIRIPDPHSASQINTIFSVDEDGEIGSLDIIECAIALERFRQYTILDDLAELG